jgi:ATP-dependent DNA ligase
MSTDIGAQSAAAGARVAPPIATDPFDWRPQAFGSRRAQQIVDPIVEPLWDGDRVLVHAAPDAVTIVDLLGELVDLLPEVETSVAAMARAERLVLDGYLTPQAAHGSEGAMLGVIDLPTSKDVASQLFLGRGGERRRGLADQGPAPVKPGETLVFVAVDVLAIDGDPIFDVPLLERRRLLESVLDEDDLVRIGAYVRPPIDPWIGSWRSQGFRAVAYKEANGRYRPGSVADGWATAQIPKR